MPRKPNPAAVASARALIAELRILHPQELDIELIAAHLGIVVRPLPLKHEEGRLIRGPTHGLINVRQSAYESQKWRFVVAHEIGHYIRHSDTDKLWADMTEEERKVLNGN